MLKLIANAFTDGFFKKNLTILKHNRIPPLGVNINSGNEGLSIDWLKKTLYIDLKNLPKGTASLEIIFDLEDAPRE